MTTSARTRPFRFGLVGATGGGLTGWTELARKAEDLGYATLLATDPLDGEHDPMMAVSAVAAVTGTLHSGTYVLADPLRSPESLRWLARTLHSLSGNRFELGIGVGRGHNERRAIELGRDFPGTAERLDRLIGTLDTIGADPGHAPLLLAGAKPRMLDIAARYADIVTFAWQPATVETDAVSIVDDFRTRAGDRIGEIELAANLIAVGDRPAPWLKQYVGIDVVDLAAREAMTVLPGDPARGADTLRRWRQRFGISYVTVNSGYIDDLAPIVAELAGS